MKTERSIAYCRRIPSTAQANKVIQIRKTLFILTQDELKPTSIAEIQRPVTTSIRTPVLRAMERRSVVKVMGTGSGANLTKLFPSRNLLPAVVRKINRSNVGASVAVLKSVEVTAKAKDGAISDRSKAFERTSPRDAKRKQVKQALSFLSGYAAKLRPSGKSLHNSRPKLPLKEVGMKEPITAENTPELANTSSFAHVHEAPATARKQSKSSIKQQRRQSLSQFAKQGKNFNQELLAALEKLALEPLVKCTEREE
eukprot:TRINITY_DN7103_c0_g1_i11.p1 TRINITY_DN7103_c0_g1~~TRINITY_DN7103_c0_g1_i11.p1  ORF type:complete len:255 (-),score=25.33 TRINITY_DN7103_c0_g1_i11:204-968(-)